MVHVVISLNWDTALEEAYRRLFGVSLPDHVLFKPHGDASVPETPWTLPHEPGAITSEVSEAVEQLSRRYVRTLLIVGYSESDEVVVEKLIAPTDETWRTIRIGPAARGLDDIPLGAEYALPTLADPYVAEAAASAWQSVTFRGSRSVDAALRGERLSPSDVDACPPLEEVKLITDALRTDRAVVLNGPTGSGKSISAYQALRCLAADGFETLRLRDSARAADISRWLTDLRFFPRRKILFVDDAQDLSPDTVRELAELADVETRVLIVGIDQVAGGVRTFRMGSGPAVVRLANWVRSNRDDVFPMVRALDSQVGDHPRDIFFDRRIDLAATELTPWLFFYTLTGGWRRIHRAAVELRDRERADLAFLIVAVAQIGGVDAGSSRERLCRLAQEIGRDDLWLEDSLRNLKSRKLVLETDDRFRCNHLQTALALLSRMLHPPPRDVASPAQLRGHAVPPIASADPGEETVTVTPTHAGLAESEARPVLSESDQRTDRQYACKLVSFLLDSPETPLRGLSWLSDCGAFRGARDVLRWQGVLSGERYERLVRRALSTPASGDVAAAAQLLARTISQSRLESVINTVRQQDDRLKEWFAAIAPENAWALGDVANSLYQPDKDLAAHIAGHADPRRLAHLVIDGGWTHSTSTGHAVDRLSNVAGPDLVAAARPYLDYDAYFQLFDDATSEFWRVTALLADLIYLDHELALRLLTQVGPRLAYQFSADPVRHWNDMFDLALHLGYVSFDKRRSRHPPEIMKAIRTFTRNLDQERIAAAIAGPPDLWSQLNFDGFLNLLETADSRVFESVCAKVDMLVFEDSLRRSATDPERKVLVIASALQYFRSAEINAIFDRLEPGLRRLDIAFAYIAPEVAMRALRRGLPLDLELAQQHWDTAAEVLSRLHARDPLVAREVAEANAQAMAVGFAAANWADPWKGLRSWISACDLAAPALIDDVIGSLPVGAVLGWRRGLSRPKKYGHSRRKDIEPLVHRAAKLGGHVASEAAQLLRRFPSLQRHGDGV
ncbi:hypothetical protein DVS77_21210 [Mycolicibacterium moriokaense]|nr:hypothetical protein DVS77_21210 [Mycolicibacterium moriokaense]